MVKSYKSTRPSRYYFIVKLIKYGFNQIVKLNFGEQETYYKTSWIDMGIKNIPKILKVNFLSIEKVIQQIARLNAIAHWKANIVLRDVEYILARTTYDDFVRVYVIDFDKVYSFDPYYGEPVIEDFFPKSSNYPRTTYTPEYAELFQKSYVECVHDIYKTYNMALNFIKQTSTKM